MYVPRKLQSAVVGDEGRSYGHNVACPETGDHGKDAYGTIPSKCETSGARKPAFGKHQNAPPGASSEPKRFSERRRQRDVHVSVAASHGAGEKLHVHLLENCSDNNTDSSLEWDYETDIHLAKLKYGDDGFDAGTLLRDAGNAPLRDASNAPLRDAGNAPLRDAGNAPLRDSGNGPLRDAGNTPLRHAGNAPLRDAGNAPLIDAGSAPLRDASNAPLRDARNAPLRDAGNAPLRYAGNAPLRDAGNAPLRDLEFDDDDDGLESDVVKTGKRRRRRRRKPSAGHEGGDAPAVVATQSWADIMENEEKRDIAPGRNIDTELNRNQSSNKSPGSTSVEAAIADAIFHGLVIENSGKERVRHTSSDFVLGSGDDRDVTDDGCHGRKRQRGGRRRSSSQGGGNRRRKKGGVSEEPVRTKQNSLEGVRSPDATVLSRGQEQHCDRAGGDTNKNVHVTTAIVRESSNSDDFSCLTESKAEIRDGLKAPLKVASSSRDAGRQVHVGPGGNLPKPRDTAPKQPMEMNPTLGDRGVVDVRGVLTTSHIAEHLGTSPLYPSHPGAPRGGRGSARGGSHRTLFDPNNPTKPVQVSSPKLQFEDPFEMQYSPDSSCFYDGYTPTGGPKQGPYNAPYQAHCIGSLADNDGPGYACPPQAYVDDSYNNEHFSHRFVQKLCGSSNKHTFPKFCVHIIVSVVRAACLV